MPFLTEREPYGDRVEAGRVLARELASFRERHPLVLGLPRGGVIPAAEVARDLETDLDVLSVAKIGAPGNPEFAIGAVSEGGALYLEKGILGGARAPEAWIEKERARVIALMRHRLKAYRAVKKRVPVGGRDVVIVDDGLATGTTMTSAVLAARATGAKGIIVAAPVASSEAITRLRALEDVEEVVCPWVPEVFFAVSQFYLDFHEVSVEEVCRTLGAGKWPAESGPVTS